MVEPITWGRARGFVKLAAKTDLDRCGGRVDYTQHVARINVNLMLANVYDAGYALTLLTSKVDLRTVRIKILVDGLSVIINTR